MDLRGSDVPTLLTTLEAFLVATILTTISLAFVNEAASFFAARVRQIFADGSLEEAFASFTTAICGRNEMIMTIIIIVTSIIIMPVVHCT